MRTREFTAVDVLQIEIASLEEALKHREERAVELSGRLEHERVLMDVDRRNLAELRRGLATLQGQSRALTGDARDTDTSAAASQLRGT